MTPTIDASQLHTPSDLRLEVTVYDAHGNVVEHHVGPSSDELLVLHTAGKCAVTCSFCHEQLAAEVGEQAAVEAMYRRAFGRAMPPCCEL